MMMMMMISFFGKQTSTSTWLEKTQTTNHRDLLGGEAIIPFTKNG